VQHSVFGVSKGEAACAVLKVPAKKFAANNDDYDKNRQLYLTPALVFVAELKAIAAGTQVADLQRLAVLLTRARIVPASAHVYV